jgi:hypothetical protein
MKAKSYSQLTPHQKVAVDTLAEKAANWTFTTINFLEYSDNEDKKATIFLDSIDIYHYPKSNVVYRGDFINVVKQWMKSNGHEQYISNKI